MSHPLLVEIIEDQFVPLLVHNNKPGADAELLKRFSEPSWNNPVVRYLNADAQDLIPRVEGAWTIQHTAERMMAALHAANRTVPTYLSEFDISPETRLEMATFAMHCFWEGEGKLGAIEGVRATRAAWRDGMEVVMVQFDPNQAAYADLLGTAKTMDCTSKVFAHTPEQMKIAKENVGAEAILAEDVKAVRIAKDSDQKYYLRQTPLIHLPLTEFQSTKINAALLQKTPFENLLSPRQIDLLKQILAIKRVNENAFDDWVCPTVENELTNYWQRLHAKIEQLAKK